MKLFYRKFGQGAPIIILHGLYGSSDNWVTIGRALSEQYEVWLLDQRNHGQSPHSSEHNYELMQEDLLEFLNEHQIEKTVLIGHSMGGKTAMRFAVNYPERLNYLIIIDIAPKSYLFSLSSPSESINHKIIIEALLDVDFGRVSERSDVDDFLSKKIKNKKIRQFLMKNVKRKDKTSFEWSLNLVALHKNIENILNGFTLSGAKLGDEITGFPVLFVKGANSDYILEDDKDSIEGIFPYAEFATIQNAGHWLHAEQPDDLLRLIKNFIE